jgi:DNA repair protein RadC
MISTNLSIKMWAEDDRPREKMILKGRKALSDAELLAILVGSGSKNNSALQVGQKILGLTKNSLAELGKLTIEELKTVEGIGDAKAVIIAAALELGRRRGEGEKVVLEKIQSSKDAYFLLNPYFLDLCHEEFRIIALNRSNHILGIDLISIGGTTGTIADGKKIFKRLLDLRATACILSHNHPSGALYPSPQDISLTKQFCEFGKMIDINIVDHLILTDKGFYSFADHGVMP